MNFVLLIAIEHDFNVIFDGFKMMIYSALGVEKCIAGIGGGIGGLIWSNNTIECVRFCAPIPPHFAGNKKTGCFGILIAVICSIISLIQGRQQFHSR